MSKQLYFEKPTQVKFWDLQPQDYIGGIAYRDEIICGECGSIIKIEDLYEEIAEEAEAGESTPAEDEVIIEMIWVPINQEIIGDDFRFRKLIDK